jgi:adenosine deaminase
VTSESRWVCDLPKIELHLHLEGAMRAATVAEMSIARLGWSGPLQAGWEHTYYTYTDFAGFMAQLTPRFPARPEEYARIAAECFEDLVAQRVIYAEVSFDVPAREVGDDSRFWPIIEALEAERRRAEALWPIRINYIAALMRSLPVEVASFRVQLAAQARDRGVCIVAIDLHGDEQNFPPACFAPAYDLARDLGFGLRAHAGEAAGIESIWDALDVLGVERIGHGVHAVNDPMLLERLRCDGIALELCPTSNVRTAAVPDLQSHPIRRFYSLGVPITVNSDDPLPFFTNVEREYRLLVDEFGMGLDDLRKITVMAARAAFMPDADRNALATLVQEAYRGTAHH